MSELTRITQFINLLTDKVLTWVTMVWSQEGEHMASYHHFLQLIQRVFDHSTEGNEIGEKLLSLKQGNQSTTEFILNFHILAVGSFWNEPALKTA